MVEDFEAVIAEEFAPCLRKTYVLTYENHKIFEAVLETTELGDMAYHQSKFRITKGLEDDYMWPEYNDEPSHRGQVCSVADIINVRKERFEEIEI